MENNLVILVDENDNEVGTMDKLEAHRKAMLHRAVSVFIFTPEGEWLLQQRAKEKYHSNSLWTNTCCTHPYPGETVLEAANRRLMEEMGLQCKLEEWFHFIYKEPLDNLITEYEFDHVFVGFTTNEPVTNKEEVMFYKYIKFKDLKEDIKKSPQHYTVWFRQIITQFEYKFNGI